MPIKPKTYIWLHNTSFGKQKKNTTTLGLRKAAASRAREERTEEPRYGEDNFGKKFITGKKVKF